MRTETQQIDPLNDARWPEFLHRHPAASVFHTRAWLAALQSTYGFRPIVVARCDEHSQITDALVACVVRSWLTGRRLVSVPFADHCALLTDSAENETAVVEHAIELSKREGCSYVELRCEHPWVNETLLAPSERFSLHTIDLTGETTATLFSKLHKDCIQRKIKRAEREGVSYACGNSQELLDEFYRLLIRTRRRHHLPPQPIKWFTNLADKMGPLLQCRVAMSDGTAVAAVITLTDKCTMTYKYGCSDERMNHLGAMPFLMWHALMDAMDKGFTTFDMGRSDLDNPGLNTFKERFGATRSTLTYWRYPQTSAALHRAPGLMRAAHQTFAYLPDRLLVASGRLLYKHIA